MFGHRLCEAALRWPFEIGTLFESNEVLNEDRSSRVKKSLLHGDNIGSFGKQVHRSFRSKYLDLA